MTATLIDAVDSKIEAALRDLETAIPARVDSYDPATQTANVTPLVRRPGLGGEGFEDMPQAQHVPVQHLGGAGVAIHVPLAAGDTGVLLCCTSDFTGWYRTAQVSDPDDVRRHHPANAVFVPGVRSRSGALSGMSATNVTIKNQTFAIQVTPARAEFGGAGDAAALASKLDEVLRIITGAPGSGVPPAWTPTPNDGGAALKAALAAYWPVPAPTGAGGTSASTRIRTDG